MNEKKRTPKQAAGGGGDGFFGKPEDPQVVHPMASVSSGPYAEDLPVAGMSVGEVRKKFADRMDIGAKMQAVINGNAVDDSTVIKAGESLMFIQYAGEKGAAKVVIEGEQAECGQHRMPVAKLAERLGPPVSTGPVILPSGIRAVLSQGNVTVMVWERPPHIAKFKWITASSPVPYGPGTQYREVRIALPYLIILATFYRDQHGMPTIMCKDECFFRNEPLRKVTDELCYPALLNCSKFPGDPKTNQSPLSWICTQYLKRTRLMSSPDPADRLNGGFEAVRYCLLETGFNLSSEHHEGNSWYGASKGIDPRISPIENWERETKKNPLFVLEVPWIKTGYTVEEAVGRIFKHAGATVGVAKSSDDVARIITRG